MSVQICTNTPALVFKGELKEPRQLVFWPGYSVYREEKKSGRKEERNENRS